MSAPIASARAPSGRTQQRGGHARRHRVDVHRAGHRRHHEHQHDADHGAEQAHIGRAFNGGGQPVHAPRHAFLLAHHHRIHRGADGGDGGRAEVAAVAITLVALLHFIDGDLVDAPQRTLVHRGRRLALAVHVGQGAQRHAGQLAEALGEHGIGLAGAAKVAALGDHDRPRQQHHQAKDGHHHPGVERHRLEDETEVALPGRLLVGTVADQARIGALRGGIGQQQRRRARHPRDAQLIQRTFEVGQRLRRTRSIGAHHGGGVQGRQIATELGDHAPIEIQLQRPLLCGVLRWPLSCTNGTRFSMPSTSSAAPSRRA
ncbi:hypothetical protein G6F22_014564 [Rhizopus arrhizus]|nr:hypothetical protein G6F22_014564 [Rhizopus arrhizus]